MAARWRWRWRRGGGGVRGSTDAVGRSCRMAAGAGDGPRVAVGRQLEAGRVGPLLALSGQGEGDGDFLRAGDNRRRVRPGPGRAGAGTTRAHSRGLARGDRRRQVPARLGRGGNRFPWRPGRGTVGHSAARWPRDSMMNAPRWFRAVPAVVLLVWGVAARGAGETSIVVVFADDWGRCAGILAEVEGRGGINDVVRTPHFDRLARSGVLFRNAHVNAPSCTPCRSSLLSGQYFWRTGRGAILQGAVWDPSIPADPLRLREAGHHIGKSFKVWSPGVPADAPYCGQRHACETAGRGGRSVTGSAPPTRTASGSGGPARRCGGSTPMTCRAGCRRSGRMCPRCGKTSPTTSARPRRWTRPSACWSTSCAGPASWSARWWTNCAAPATRA